MKRPHHFQSGRKKESEKNGYDGKSIVIFYSVSIVLHLFVVMGMVYVQNYSVSPILPDAIRVDLVSFSPLSDADASHASSVTGEPPVAEQALPEAPPSVIDEIETSEPVPEPKTISEPEVREISEPEIEAVVMQPPQEDNSPPVKEKSVEAAEPPSVEKEIPILKPSRELEKKTDDLKKKEPPQKKKSLKSKTYKSEKVLATAPKKSEHPVKENSADSLTRALSRLQKKVDRQAGAEGRTSGGVSRGSGTSGGKGKKSRVIDLYNLELMYRIRQNWVFNERLARADKNTEVRILIKILKNGSIRDILFETRSGNAYLDESAFKAIKKSNPLSPLPKGYDSYDVGLIFTPSGLQ